MFGLYDIYCNQTKIGKAEVSREGLYYRFRCCCDLPEGEIYRLCVTCGDRTENLGIPVPNGDSFWLSVRLPVSRFSGDEPIFRAMPREQRGWAPVIPEVPFPYLSELENAVLGEKDGEMGIFISESNPQDNDPNP